MRTNTFGTTLLQVSPLGFGGAPIGFLGTEPSRIGAILGKLLDSGINVIDTAECYPGSEEAIGRAVGHRRSEYILVSKCGHKVDGLEGDEWSGKLISATVDNSLRRLRTDHLDVVLLHSCDLHTLKAGEVVDVLARARAAGKVRWIGYSGDNEAASYAADLSDISVLEVSVSICDQANIDLVLPKARARNLAVLAKRPLANAAWRPLSAQQGIYADYAKTYHERLSAMGLEPTDLGYPGKAEDTWPELALRFTLSQPEVSSAIVGTTNPDRIAANIAAVERGPLPRATVDRIRSAFRDAEAASDGRWTGQT